MQEGILNARLERRFLFRIPARRESGSVRRRSTSGCHESGEVDWPRSAPPAITGSAGRTPLGPSSLIAWRKRTRGGPRTPVPTQPVGHRRRLATLTLADACPRAQRPPAAAWRADFPHHPSDGW